MFVQGTTAAVARYPAANTDRALELPTGMTAGNPPLILLDLPVEILEGVVLRLHAREILKLRAVRLFPFGILTGLGRSPRVPPLCYSLAEPRIPRPDRGLSSRPIPRGPFLSCVGG
jgi:hypothetical protein